jgi:hypothetical protein
VWRVTHESYECINGWTPCILGAIPKELDHSYDIISSIIVHISRRVNACSVWMDEHSAGNSNNNFPFMIIVMCQRVDS